MKKWDEFPCGGRRGGRRDNHHRLERIELVLDVLLTHFGLSADEIDAYIMKKTTQESTEWFGRANC